MPRWGRLFDTGGCAKGRVRWIIMRRFLQMLPRNGICFRWSLHQCLCWYDIKSHKYGSKKQEIPPKNSGNLSLVICFHDLARKIAWVEYDINCCMTVCDEKSCFRRGFRPKNLISAEWRLSKHHYGSLFLFCVHLVFAGVLLLLMNHGLVLNLRVPPVETRPKLPHKEAGSSPQPPFFSPDGMAAGGEKPEACSNCISFFGMKRSNKPHPINIPIELCFRWRKENLLKLKKWPRRKWQLFRCILHDRHVLMFWWYMEVSKYGPSPRRA